MDIASRSRKRRGAGFTLVEVAIVLFIGGIIIAAVSESLRIYIKNAQISEVERKLDDIDQALQLFVNLNGRLPCVAPMNAAPDTPEFGVQLDPATDCAAHAVVPGESVQYNGVRIGSVPVRTLNLPDGHAVDPWGNRFTYAVTEVLTTSAYDQTLGTISVIDSEGNSVISPAGSAHYVLLSHGADGSGAVASSGMGGPAPCPGVGMQIKNCDYDDEFLSTLLTGSADNDYFYDDYIRMRASSSIGQTIPPGAVMAFALHQCPFGWVAYANAQDRFIVGSGGVYNLNQTGGEATHTLTNEEIGFEPHSYNLPNGGPSNFTLGRRLGAPVAHENLPPYIALLYCRKT